MSLKLYFSPGACSFVPHSLLQLTGASFEPIMVKLHKGEQLTPEFKAINPNGQVPVLVADGRDDVIDPPENARIIAAQIPFAWLAFFCSS